MKQNHIDQILLESRTSSENRIGNQASNLLRLQCFARSELQVFPNVATISWAIALKSRRKPARLFRLP